MSLTLNKQALKRGDTLPVLMLAYFLSEEKIKTTFKKVGLSIDSMADIEALAEIIKKRLDTSGVLKSGSNPVIFSAMDLLKSIRYSENEKERVKEIIFE